MMEQKYMTGRSVSLHSLCPRKPVVAGPGTKRLPANALRTLSGTDIVSGQTQSEKAVPGWAARLFGRAAGLLKWPKKAWFEMFRAQTFPHLEVVYSDAFCLMGCQADAADLVVETYVRAFGSYPQFRRRRIPKHLQAQSTLTWLYGKMHDAFCDEIFARVGHSPTTNAIATNATAINGRIPIGGPL